MTIADDLRGMWKYRNQLLRELAHGAHEVRGAMAAEIDADIDEMLRVGRELGIFEARRK